MFLDALITAIAFAAAHVQPRQDATLSMEGRVVDERGEPMPRMRIVLSYPGESTIIAPLSLTGEQGVFKLSGLRPGEYSLCADSGPLLQLMRTDGRFEGEHPIRTCETVLLSTRPLSGLEVAMRRGPLYSVSGSVKDADGHALADAAFTFEVPGSPPLGSIDIKHATDGRFVVRGVPPGDYVIRVRRTNPDRMPIEIGTVPVRVASADIEDVVVQTAKPARIVGRIEFAEGLTGPLPKFNVNTVGLRSRAPGSFENASHVREDRTFQLDGLLGPQMVQVFGAMKPWTVKTISYRGEDVFGKPVEFRSGTDPNDLVVVLTNQSASITARLRTASEQAGSTVVLIPLDPRTGAPLENAAFRPIDAEAPFGLPLVRPGDYLIAAITKEDAAGTPASIARRLVRVAQRITLAPGEQRTIELDLVRPR